MKGPEGRPGGRFSWLGMLYLIVAMLAIGVATIYATRIIEGDGDHFDWFMSVVLVIIGISNALQFFRNKRK